MTYKEWLVWTDDSHRSEWVDGEVLVFMPPTKPHQRVVVFLTAFLEFFVELRDLGIVLVAPFEMRLGAVGTSREPDLLFVAKDHLDRLSDERLDGPADAVFEVISDSTAVNDRRDKFVEYAAAGVPEYWQIDPRPGRQRIDPYTLAKVGAYDRIETDGQGRYHSTVLPGFWLDREWFRSGALPSPFAALAAIAPETLAAAVARVSVPLQGSNSAR